MKSKKLIEKQIKKKRNPELVETLILAKKNESWRAICEKLSTSKRNRLVMNLSEIDEKTSEKESVIVPGKVLSEGDLTKKIRIVSFSISEKAKEKLIKSGSAFSTILEEIKKNPSAKGLKILVK